MGASLSLHGRAVHSVYELLGSKENDLTFSLGWALAQSPALRSKIVAAVFGPGPCDPDLRVLLQERVKGGGITDIEIIGRATHIVIEAKRGATLPDVRQLELYKPRLLKERRARRALVAMSECPDSFAQTRLPASVGRTPVKHVSWQRVQRLAKTDRGAQAEKRLLKEFALYLERVVKMQDQESNLVFVVSLSDTKPRGSPLTFFEIVEQRRRYFNPIGVRGYPKEPQNYIAFRYRGRLHSIHHVERWAVATDVRREIPELKMPRWKEPHYVYTLGPPIKPAREVRTGRVFGSGRVWAMLDLLLTCRSVSEARDRTKQRLRPKA